MRIKLYNRKKLMIIVNPNSRLDILYDYLRGFGYDVTTAMNGNVALEMVKETLPDVILLEVSLPGLDGFDVCRELKARPATQNIPVMFMTSSNNPVDKVRAFTLGAIDYITKPIQSEEILARLKTHLTLQNLKSTLEEQNKRLQAEIIEREKLIEELDTFAHTVAHDLKNPLGVTISYAQFLSKYGDQLTPDQLTKYTDIIMKNGHKMTSIIDELLLLASARQEEVELRPLNMGHIANEAQDRLLYIIEEAEAEIIVPESWPTSIGYGPWVEEVWANYISNAIKYGGSPPRVELSALVKDNGMIQFRVWDNGQGLSAEQQSKLFTPFTRLERKKVDGHGLGLSIVQRIIEKLGGNVGVTSPNIPGQGSIFYFTLPQYDENL
ncbi:hybrid sensor histidine kinase/response regulator [Anaerolineales bacterium HSG6]|nr:hybrid sensor histidine kinase/response regulator [Anaerolineales bacterium HSG6]MDM8532590.1 hybrid sensor histidine kinase/response regulator [Anaerolineales bacterium HSG25]